MKNNKIGAVVSSMVGLALILASGSAGAETLGGAKDKLGGVNQQINSLQAQVSDRAQVAATLQSQIENMNGQIEALKVKVADTMTKVATTDASIAAVELKMSEKKHILQAYIRNQAYEPEASTFEMIVTSDNLSSFVDRKEYINQAEEKVQKLMADILAVKKSLDEQKLELVKLNDQLASQQSSIDAQRVAKNELLAKTKGEQANYEALLVGAEAARNRLTVAIADMMGEGSPASQGHVQAGDVIGREGSTGFSTGPHVHFGVYAGKAAVNPRSYLKSGRVIWPLTDPEVTQDYGPASWSNSHYSFHDGIDIDQGYGAPVRAACSGNIIMNSFQPNGFGHYITIDCGGGVWALVAHMQ